MMTSQRSTSLANSCSPHTPTPTLPPTPLRASKHLVNTYNWVMRERERDARLDTQESRQIADQTDWREKQPPKGVGVSEDLKCWGAWDIACRREAKVITPSIAWKGERARRRQRKRSMTTLLERTREAIVNQGQHWNCSKGSVGQGVRGWSLVWATGHRDLELVTETSDWSLTIGNWAQWLVGIGCCDCWELVADRWELVADRWELAADCWELVADRWELFAVTVGSWSLTVGNWSLTGGNWSLNWSLTGGNCSLWLLGTGRWLLGTGRSAWELPWPLRRVPGRCDCWELVAVVGNWSLWLLELVSEADDASLWLVK